MTAKTSVDWLRFRTKAELLDGLEALKPMFGGLGSYLHLKHGQRGILGFQRSAQVVLADVVVGRVDFGGESQRGWARWDIPGKGCQWVADWDAVADVEALPGAEIRRLDVCLTTWNHEVNHEMIVSGHTAGRFVCGGRPPALLQIVSSDPRAGRTCEVGKREKADKFFRGYEKGWELLSAVPDSIRSSVTHLQGVGPDGNPAMFEVDGIYRCEVELKAENKPIPWEVIERRDQYFAGSYPFLADLLPGVESDILQRRPERAPQVDLAIALENCRIQYGATLFTALHAYQGDIGAVFEKIIGKGHNQALIESGVLMVEHE